MTHQSYNITSNRWFVSNKLLSTRKLAMDSWMIERCVSSEVMNADQRQPNRFETHDRIKLNMNLGSSFDHSVLLKESGSVQLVNRMTYRGFQGEKKGRAEVNGNHVSKVANKKRNDLETFDEIHSVRFSSVLEETKTQLVECLPFLTEEVISYAIIHAFADNTKNAESADYTLDLPRNCLRNAENWVKDRKGSFDKEQALTFLRESLHQIFLCIRDHNLSAQQAVQIVIHIARILGLEDGTFNKDSNHPPGSPKNTGLVHLSEQINDESPRCVMKHISYHDYRKRILQSGK